MSNPFVYVVKDDGKLLWYNHLGAAAGTFTWDGPKEVGTGWNNFKKTFAAGDGVIYAINQDNHLLWYRHIGFPDGRFTWEGPHTVAEGWDYKTVFAGDNGVIYAIENLSIDPRTGQSIGGHLIWHKHLGYYNGFDKWAGPKKVGHDWRSFKHVLYGGAGVIYAVAENGDLMWYLHKGYENGAFAWAQEKKVGNGWNFTYIFSGGEGIIYAVQPTSIDPRLGQRLGGNLQWYKHLGYQDGSFRWEEPKQVGKSWRNMLSVFAGGTFYNPIQAPQAGRRCGVPDVSAGGIRITTYGPPGGKWSRGNLTYSVNPAGANVTPNFVNTVIGSAFTQVSNAVPYFSFRQVAGTADLRIQFGGSALNERFGPADTVLAVGYYPEDGRIHFDATDDWSGTNTLLSVALHEIGHALGLSHSNTRLSLMYPVDLSITALDNETITALRNLYGWKPQERLEDRASSDGPCLGVGGRSSLAGRNDDLFAVWKGVAGDSAVYWSNYQNEKWTPQKRIEGIGSAHGPSITTGFNTTAPDGTPVTELFMAWDGAPGDSNIYYSQTRNLAGWKNQERVEGVGTSDRPAVCMFNGRMYMAWKGISGDSGLYYSTFDGVNWSAQKNIRGRGSSDGPTMAVLGNRLYMFWKGVAGDSDVYYSWIDNGNAAIWQSQQRVQYTVSQEDGNVNLNIGSSKRVIAATRGNTIFLGWKGKQNDAGIYFSSFENNEFSGQVRIDGVGTSAGPGLAIAGNRICMKWKGVDGDSNLYTSWLG